MKRNLFSLLSSVAVAMHMNPFPESTGHCLQAPYALRVGQKSRRHP